jgi:hypothetical protein
MLTLERKKKILECAARGCSRKTCAQIASISERTLRHWLAKGRENIYAVEDTLLAGGQAEIDDYGEFFLQFEVNEAIVKQAAHKCILLEIEAGNLEAAKFLLQTKEPETYGRGTKFTLSTLDGEGQEVDVAALLIERLATIEERSSKAIEGTPYEEH